MQKMLPRVLFAATGVSLPSVSSSSFSCFTWRPLGWTHRFWSALNVQMRTTTPQPTQTPTLLLARAHGERLSVRRPLAAQRRSPNLQHHQSRNPLPVLEIPHVRVAVLRARQNAVVVRIPVQTRHRQVMLSVTIHSETHSHQRVDQLPILESRGGAVLVDENII